MLLHALSVDGHASGDSACPDVLEKPEFPSRPGGAALVDGLVLIAGALAPRRLDEVVTYLGWDTDVDDPEQLSVPHGGAVGLVGEQGAITVEATFGLDPVLYGELRQVAMRTPGIAAALVNASELSVKVGWLFTRDRRVVSISVMGVAVGDMAVPLNTGERPAWLDSVLEGVGQRIGIPLHEGPEELAERLHQAWLSPEPEIRRGARDVLEAFADPILGFVEALELVEVDGIIEPRWGSSLLPARHFGHHAVWLLRVLVEAHLLRPDILVVCDPPSKHVFQWLEGLPEAENAPIEQVVSLPGVWV